MRARDIPEIARLSTAEKILLVEDLWDDIAANASDLPVPQSHLDEIDRRLAAHAANPGRLLTLQELKQRIDART
jgi:putative addiction module component (TIGR02574 family)